MALSLTPKKARPHLDPSEPPPLPGEHLRPVVDVELREKISAAVIHAVMSTKLCERVSGEKLSGVLFKSFERFCDGRTFDFEPILKSLMRDPRVREEDCAEAAATLAKTLRGLSVTVNAPQLREEKKAARLGELLVKHRLIFESQLEQALRAQTSFGGRVGSHLIKLGYIQEGALAHFLGVQRNAPAVDPAVLRSTPIDTLRIVSPELARKYRAIPFSLKNNTLRVAMVDPGDRLAIAELAASTGYRIAPSVAPEGLIESMLTENFGARGVKARSLSLAGGVDLGTGEHFQVIHTSDRRRPKKREGEAAAPAATARGGAAISVEDRGEFFKSERADLELDDRNVEDLAIDLTRAVDAAAVLRIAAKMVTTRFAKVAVFSAEGSTISGAAAFGCAIGEEDFRKIGIQLADCATFRELRPGRPIVSGAFARTALDVTLHESLAIAVDAEPIRMAIFHEGRAVGFVVAAEERGERDLRFFERVAEKSRLALEMIALRKKIIEG
jgi:hypothetical protein